MYAEKRHGQRAKHTPGAAAAAADHLPQKRQKTLPSHAFQMGLKERHKQVVSFISSDGLPLSLTESEGLRTCLMTAFELGPNTAADTALADD